MLLKKLFRTKDWLLDSVMSRRKTGFVYFLGRHSYTLRILCLRDTLKLESQAQRLAASKILQIPMIDTKLGCRDCGVRPQTNPQNSLWHAPHMLISTLKTSETHV